MAERQIRATQRRCERRIELVGADDAYGTDCDVFSPNAVGGALNRATIPRLRCRIVVGGANNQLGEDADGARLAGRGILYAPDYVINSAAPYAVIGAGELGYPPERSGLRWRASPWRWRWSSAAPGRRAGRPPRSSARSPRSASPRPRG